MAKTKQQKEATVKDLTERLKKMKSLIFVNFEGLTVNEVGKLRKKCREEKVDYLVAKKTLLRLALEKANLKDVVDPKSIEGGMATVISYEDEVAPAKVLADFAKEHQALKIAGGILENKFVEIAIISDLAKLPSKQELLAKVVASIQAPLTGLVNVLEGVPRNLVYVLKAIQKVK